ncbi:flavin reductase family protein [Nocardia sp. CA-120079]|uniref:flavin reductase family protein n=1 Tax=Nocardia sp. CA-120079 TaxID=3239974 RepID=UPI003D99CC82
MSLEPVTSPVQAAVPDRWTFRDVVGRFTSGVTVITTVHEGIRRGITVSAFTSLSDDPPSVVVCLNRKSATGRAVRVTRRFAVNILTEQQLAHAGSFARRGDDKFAGIPIVDEAGVPLLDGALAHLICEVDQDIESGTHVVLLARVTAVWARESMPLAYYRGAFGRFVPNPSTS